MRRNRFAIIVLWNVKDCLIRVDSKPMFDGANPIALDMRNALYGQKDADEDCADVDASTDNIIEHAFAALPLGGVLVRYTESYHCAWFVH